MSANLERSPEDASINAPHGDLDASPPVENPATNESPLAVQIPVAGENHLAAGNSVTVEIPLADEISVTSEQAIADETSPTLASLPIGARLLLRCRKDWRDATVAYLAPDTVVLSVGSPTGRTYRVRRPPDSPLSFDGSIPVLGADASQAWRNARARYDARW